MRTADTPLFTLTQLEDRLLLSATLLNAGATAMVYDSAGALHVAYYDTADRTLKYTARSPSGAWDPAITLDPTPYAGAELSIALDATGRPAVAYYDGTNRDLRFAQKTRRGWTVQTLDAAGTVGHNPSLAFTPDGFPLVSYYAASTADLRLASFNGTRWYVSTIDATGSVGRFSDLAISPLDGSWAIAYESQSDHTIRYAQKWGKSFTTRVIDTLDGADANWLAQPTLAFNSTGNPLVSYVDGDDLVLNRAGRKTWTRSTIVDGGVTSPDTTLFLDADAPRLLYAHAGHVALSSATPAGDWLTTDLSSTTPLAIAPLADQVSLLAPGGVVTSYRADLTLSAPDLTLTIDTPTPDHVDLTWTGLPADATFVIVERAPAAAELLFTTIATLPAGSTQWTDAQVIEGVSYVYRLRAGNAVTLSSPTPAATARADLPPTAPADLQTANVSAGVRITWSDASTHALGYRIERSADAGATFETLAELVQPDADGGYLDTTAAERTAYLYRVTAIGASAESVPTAAPIETQLRAPSNFTFTTTSSPTAPPRAKIHLNWTANSALATQYVVYMSTDGVNFAPVPSANISWSGSTFIWLWELNTQTTYSFKVHAADATGESVPADDPVIQVTTALAPPSSVLFDIHQEFTGDAWTVVLKSSGSPYGPVTGYLIERRVDYGAYRVVDRVYGATLDYVDAMVDAGRTYYYRVTPFNAAGNGPGTSEEREWIPPAAPVMTSAAFLSGGGPLRIAWDTTNLTAYKVRVHYLSPFDGQDHVAGTYDPAAGKYDPSSSMYGVGFPLTDENGQSLVNQAIKIWLTAVVIDPTYAYPYTQEGLVRSNSAWVYTGLASPPALAVTPSAPGTLDVSWAAVQGATWGYLLEMSTDGGATYTPVYGGRDPFFRFTGAQPGVPYTFKVVCQSVKNSFSAPVTAYAPPALPTTLVATRLDDGRVQLTWDDPTAGAAAYTLSFARGNQPVDPPDIFNLPAGTTSYTFDASLFESGIPFRFTLENTQFPTISRLTASYLAA